jgi:TusA-related sulfurtransferase
MYTRAHVRKVVVPVWREVMSDVVECDAEVDATGLNCPLASGAVLKVLATDAGSQRDFRTFAHLAGHTLLHEKVEAGVYTYWLKKA